MLGQAMAPWLERHRGAEVLAAHEADERIPTLAMVHIRCGCGQILPTDDAHRAHLAHVLASLDTGQEREAAALREAADDMTKGAAHPELWDHAGHWLRARADALGPRSDTAEEGDRG